LRIENKQLTGIRKQIERVYRDEDMSPEEKRTRLDALYQRRNQVTRQAVERATAAR
jgi:hypothetical protein